jgi:hypothetical protein
MALVKFLREEITMDIRKTFGMPMRISSLLKDGRVDNGEAVGDVDPGAIRWPIQSISTPSTDDVELID